MAFKIVKKHLSPGVYWWSCTPTRRNHNQPFRTIGANSAPTNFHSSHEQYQFGITSATILSIVPPLNNSRHDSKTVLINKFLINHHAHPSWKSSSIWRFSSIIQIQIINYLQVKIIFEPKCDLESLCGL